MPNLQDEAETVQSIVERLINTDPSDRKRALAFFCKSCSRYLPPGDDVCRCAESEADEGPGRDYSASDPWAGKDD